MGFDGGGTDDAVAKSEGALRDSDPLNRLVEVERRSKRSSEPLPRGLTSKSRCRERFRECLSTEQMSAQVNHWATCNRERQDRPPAVDLTLPFATTGGWQSALTGVFVQTVLGFYREVDHPAGRSGAVVAAAHVFRSEAQPACACGASGTGRHRTRRDELEYRSDSHLSTRCRRDVASRAIVT